MILRHKKTRRLYNFDKMTTEDNGLNCTLHLELWFRDKNGKIKSAKRSFTYSSFESIKELLNGFEELAGLCIDDKNFGVYEEEGDKFVI